MEKPYKVNDDLEIENKKTYEYNYKDAYKGEKNNVKKKIIIIHGISIIKI
ncbi:MAG: hypothetical protein L6V81_03130 [Clostridium sp.]|nr:MAG: hypothetical protein L6V81_03130 [Clostridium sp.]